MRLTIKLTTTATIRRGALALALTLSCSLAACLAEREGDVGNTGGETHWMSACEDNSACGPLACICGVCTIVCEDANSCGGLPDAECVLTCGDGQDETSVCVPTIPAPDTTNGPDVVEDTSEDTSGGGTDVQFPVDAGPDVINEDTNGGGVDIGIEPDADSCPPGFDIIDDACVPHCNHNNDCDDGEMCVQDCDDSCDQSAYPNPCCTRSCVQEPAAPQWVCGTGDGTSCESDGGCEPNSVQSVSWGETTTWDCADCCVPAACSSIFTGLVCGENPWCEWQPTDCGGFGDFCASPNQGTCIDINDGPCGPPPVAVIEHTFIPTGQIGTTIGLSGSAAAPAFAANYQWRVEQPAGSQQIVVPSAFVQNVSFNAVLIGTYTFYLIVIDACGVESIEVSKEIVIN